MSVDDRASTSADRLLGAWRIERADGGIDGTTPTDIEFLPGGLADYCVHVGGGWHVIPLVFRIEGDVLVTHPRPPMVPQEERTRIRFEPDGALVMEHGGGRVWLRRAERRAPRSAAGQVGESDVHDVHATSGFWIAYQLAGQA